MKINVKHYHIEVEVNLPDDADMSDIIDSIKGILSICGWSDETWRDQIIELSEHYQKQEQKQLITEIMNDDANDGLYKTNNMKLYTEEQVKLMIEKSRETGLTAEFLIIATPPIELPSDEEIKNLELEYAKNFGTNMGIGFKIGCQWMKEQILNQNK